MKIKTIKFIMPCLAFSPVGGFKVVNEYARRLASDGYDVEIIYPLLSNFGSRRKRLKAAMKDIILLLLPNRKIYSAEGCKKKILSSLSRIRMDDGSIYIATSVETAMALKSKLHGKNKNPHIIYFIQDYEAWNITESVLSETYKYGFTNVVISHWLESKVKNCGSDCAVIPNGFDFDYFKLDSQPEERNQQSIAMLWHHDERKGCKYGLEAIQALKMKYPNLTVTFFGVPNRPDYLPDWITYHKTPNRELHNRIYNSAAIFVAPSLQEGWGLTVGEAMICGCAVCCTDIGGFREMCCDEMNALMSPVKDVDKMTENIERLMTDDKLRLRIAHSGIEHINRFKWENSYNNFKEIVSDYYPNK